MEVAESHGGPESLNGFAPRFIGAGKVLIALRHHFVAEDLRHEHLAGEIGPSGVCGAASRTVQTHRTILVGILNLHGGSSASHRMAYNSRKG